MRDNVDINIRFYQPGDDENIVELLKKTFPKWKKSDDPLKLWRWKYVNTPQRTIVVVAVIDNKIVGCNHSIVFNAKIGSEVTSLGYSDDLAVDIDYRGLGLFSKMSPYKEKKLATLTKYQYLTSINPTIINSWNKEHRDTFPFPVTRMVRTNNIDLHLRMRPMKNMLLIKFGYNYFKILNGIINPFRSPISRIDEFKIAEIFKFDEGIDSFWEKIKDDYNFILEKKHVYLNWRFSSTIKGNHIIVQAMKGEVVLGYVVIGLMKENGYTEGQIEDLIALKNRLDVADALLDYACKYLDDLGINTVYYQVVEGHPYQDLSIRRGFLNSRSKPNIAFDYSDHWNNKSEIKFLKHTAPSQVYFNYAETL